LANHNLSLHEFGLPDGEALSPEERALLERLRACDDIVHGWDDPADFSWLKKPFSIAFAS
jgi:hypothetical protein